MTYTADSRHDPDESHSAEYLAWRRFWRRPDRKAPETSPPGAAGRGQGGDG